MSTRRKSFIVIGVALFGCTLTLGFFCGKHMQTAATKEASAIREANQLVLISALQCQCGIVGTGSVFRLLDSTQDRIVATLWNNSRSFSKKSKDQVNFLINSANTAHKYYTRSEPLSDEDREFRNEANNILQEVREMTTTGVQNPAPEQSKTTTGKTKDRKPAVQQ